VNCLAGRGSVQGGNLLSVKFSKYVLTRAYIYTNQGTRTPIRRKNRKNFGIEVAGLWLWLVLSDGWSVAVAGLVFAVDRLQVLSIYLCIAGPVTTHIAALPVSTHIADLYRHSHAKRSHHCVLLLMP
jgi:hypothetical protein